VADYLAGRAQSLGAFGLSQSEIAGNEDHHYNNTNDVENIIHVSFSFLRVIGSPLRQVNARGPLPAPTRISPATTTE
jgi:hypothetical protein